MNFSESTQITPKAISVQLEQAKIFLEQAPASIAMFDREMCYLLASQDWLEDYQLNHQSLVGKSYYQIFPNCSPELQQKHQDCLAGNNVEINLKLPLPNKCLKWVSFKLKPWRDEIGNIEGLMMFSEFISELKRQETVTDIHQISSILKKTEKQLQQTQNFLESVLETLPVAVVAKEAKELRFVLWNPTATDVLGFAAEDVIGKNDYDCFPKEQADFFTKIDREVLSSGKILDIPAETVQNKLGEARILHTQKTAILDANGQPQYLLAITEDITERKQAEEALLKREMQLRLALKASQMGVWYWEMTTNKVSWSEGLEALVGLSPGCSTASYKSYLKQVYPEDKRLVKQVFNQALQTKTGYEIEHRICLSNDKVRWIGGKADFVKDDLGVIIGLAGTFADITERKQAEQLLRESETLSKKQAQALEKTLHTLQRTQSHLVQSEKMSALGQLVAGVAHEINNPVNFIYGNLSHAEEYSQDLLKLLQGYQNHCPQPAAEIEELAQEIEIDFLREDLPNLLSSMKVGAERIIKIVASLRNFSRIDEVDIKDIDIHEGIDSTLLILQSHFKAKNAHPGVQIVKEYGKLPLVECYPAQLNQVFMNILTNALDAIHERDQARTFDEIKQQPSIICISTEFASSDKIRIKIADNGLGMSRQVQQRLFDPFFTTKPVGKGTGLGLSISYSIVTEKHGGSLKCCSVPGKGTEFVIEIPIQKST